MSPISSTKATTNPTTKESLATAINQPQDHCMVSDLNERCDSTLDSIRRPGRGFRMVKSLIGKPGDGTMSYDTKRQRLRLKVQPGTTLEYHSGSEPSKLAKNEAHGRMNSRAHRLGLLVKRAVAGVVNNSLGLGRSQHMGEGEVKTPVVRTVFRQGGVHDP